MGTVTLLLVGAVIGAFIGWHVPQPSWIKKIEDKVEEEAKEAVAEVKQAAKETVAEVKAKVTRARKMLPPTRNKKNC